MTTKNLVHSEPEMEQVTEAEASTNAEIVAERNEPQYDLLLAKSKKC